MSRHVRLAVALVLLAYAAVALTPIRNAIGRVTPETAAIFSPPGFNFHAAYDSDDVMGLTVGSNRNEIVEQLETQFRREGLLDPSCGQQTAGASGTGVPIGSHASDVFLNRDTICVDLPSRRIVLVIYLEDDAVRLIEVTKVTFGL